MPPHPKPVEAKIREGNPGHVKLSKLPEPFRVGGAPDLDEPPPELDEHGRAFWEAAVPQLNKVGLLSAVDRPALEMAASAYSDFRHYEELMRREGVISVGSKGQPRVHPAARSKERAMITYLRFAQDYALTPTARTRLGMAELQRRSMVEEMAEELGPAKLEVVEAES